MRLVEIINRASIGVDLRSTSKPEVLAELAGLLACSLPDADPEEIARTLMERERLATTGVGEGVAIPHGKLPGIRRIVAALGIARTGIPFDAVDGQPVRVLVALLAPPESTGDHLKALARVSRLLKDPAFRQRLIDSSSGEDAWRIIDEEDGRH
jgi:PTS system nitrogen regulatory IIA component